MDGLDYGVIGGSILTILATVGTALWTVSKYLARKFFDDRDGYVPNYLRKHYEFIDGLAEREKIQQGLCEQHVEVIAQTSNDVTTLKAAGVEACKLCREVMVDPTESMNARLSNIEQVLTGATQ